MRNQWAYRRQAEGGSTQGVIDVYFKSAGDVNVLPTSTPSPFILYYQKGPIRPVVAEPETLPEIDSSADKVHRS